MTLFASISRILAPALCGLGFLVSQTAAAPVVRPTTADGFTLVASDCYAIGQRIAAQNGGTLAKATPGSQGGQAVCSIVVLVPGENGQRPRRKQVVVPQE